MIHIGIDASRFHTTTQKTGVEWYTYHLLTYFQELLKEEAFQEYSLSLYTPKPLGLEYSQRFQEVRIPGKRFWTMFHLPLHLLTHKKPDLFFVPSHVLPPISTRAKVTTIHDVAFAHFPEVYSKKEHALLSYGVKKGKSPHTHIITVSEATKQDLIDSYGYKDTTITVIPLGYQSHQSKGEEDTQAVLKKYTLTAQNFCLYVGRIEKKKNCARLIEAFLATHTDPTFTLVLAGKLGFGGEEIYNTYRHEPRIRFTGYTSEEEVAVLFKQARFFTIPSLYEGFCMPILEAFSYSLAVLTSNRSSMPEVGGNGCLYVDPEHTQSITKGIEQLYADKALREEYAREGQKRVQAYSWEQCARQTLTLLGEQAKKEAQHRSL